MRGWKPLARMLVIPSLACRTLSPDNEGMETRRPSGRAGDPAGAGHSAPTMRGWKPWLLASQSSLQMSAGHSAPTMRGWKLVGGAYLPGRTPSRTLSPDNEGMETSRPTLRFHPPGRMAGHSAPTMRGWKLGVEVGLGHSTSCRTLSPDNEGMETIMAEVREMLPLSAGHSAPTMRGWKHGASKNDEHFSFLAGHSAPTMRGWKHTGSIGMLRCRMGRTLSPDNEGMETRQARAGASSGL